MSYAAVTVDGLRSEDNWRVEGMFWVVAHVYDVYCVILQRLSIEVTLIVLTTDVTTKLFPNIIKVILIVIKSILEELKPAMCSKRYWNI